MTEMQLIGFGPWVRFIWKGHITNWFWRDRLTRRLTRNKAFGEFKMCYLKKYSDFARAIQLPSQEKATSPEDNNKIFMLWFQGEENAPDIVKKCIGSIKKRYSDRVVLLTEKNLYDYITLPDFIMKKWHDKQIGAANFSDLVRIELLYQYGGYWFDATDFLTGEIPEEIEKSSFFMYISSDVFFPHMFVQTCFMRCFQKDPLLGMWRTLVHEYWKREDVSCEYFLVHMLLKLLVRENPHAAALFERMPKLVMDPTHLLWNSIGDLPYSDSLYKQMCNDSFFQKCSYRPQRHGVKSIIPGSMADVVVNRPNS